MKVADAMSKRLDYVTVDTSVKKVARLIFGKRISGIPVCKNRKVVGFITERDILTKFYPTMQEYMEDPVHAVDFEKMEDRVAEIFNLTADKIMSKHPIKVKKETPLLKAQSIMFVKKVGRLPVIDEEGNLIGVIAKRDIFEALVGKRFRFAKLKSKFK